MKKTVLFAPGFREDIGSRDYASVLRAIEQHGYDVRFVSIGWKRTTIHDWVQQLEAEYEKYDPQDTILAGFSFGALTAFVTAARRLPFELWLFSLSPLFSEDLPNIKQSELNQLGTRRVKTAKQTSFCELAKQLTCPVKLFVGSQELAKWTEMRFRFEQAHTELANVHSVIIDSVGHAIEDRRYIVAIEAAI